MPTRPLLTTGHFYLRSRVWMRIRDLDRPAWRRFFLALLGLTLSFFLALYATALRESGRYELAAFTAALSLLLAGLVAVKAVPYLARRTALKRWMVRIEYEFTREGVVYLAIIGAIAAAALNTGNNLLFMMLACLLAAILVSGIFSKIVLSAVELEFALPEHLFAEQRLVARVTLRNLKRYLPSFSITVSSEDASKKRRRGGLAALAERGRVAPPRRTGSDSRCDHILNEPVYVSYLPPRSSVTQHVEVTFPRRGRYTQNGFRLSTKFPFGLLRKARQVPARQEILVLPNIQPTEEFYEILPLLSGEVESFYKGRGHDLYAIRDYQASDTARHVDWKATAKAQHLKVREFTREDERRVVLVFDARLRQSDAQTLGRFEKAVTFCACLAWHFYEIEAQMQFVSDDFETPMERAAGVIYAVLEKLALIEPKLETPIPSRSRGDDLLARMGSVSRGFSIILTSQPRGSIPTHLWGSSYIIFMDSL